MCTRCGNAVSPPRPGPKAASSSWAPDSPRCTSAPRSRWNRLGHPKPSPKGLPVDNSAPVSLFWPTMGRAGAASCPQEPACILPPFYDVYHPRAASSSAARGNLAVLPTAGSSDPVPVKNASLKKRQPRPRTSRVLEPRPSPSAGRPPPSRSSARPGQALGLGAAHAHHCPDRARAAAPGW